MNDGYRVVESYARTHRGFYVDGVSLIGEAVVQEPDDNFKALGGDSPGRSLSIWFGSVRFWLGIPPLLGALVWIYLVRRGRRRHNARTA